MPPVLARWKPKDREPQPGRNPALPPASNRYYELEAMKQFCGPEEWERLPETRRAELIAHENERNLREAYQMEDVMEKGGGGGENNVVSAMRRRVGLGKIE